MMPVRKLRLVALVAMASLGLFAGHSLTYLRLAPAGASAEQLLRSTGHGYLHKVLILSVALAAMSALFWIAGGLLKSRFDRPKLTHNVVALALIQCVGFGVQEVLERVLAGASLRDLAVVMLLGLPVQLLAAGIGALLITALHRAGTAIARLLEAPARRERTGVAFPAVQRVHFSSAVLPGGLRSRGPPALLS